IPVVDLLRAVDLVAGRHAGDVEVSDPAARLADSAREIAIHDLQVIDIADELDVRRIDALADRDAPVPVTEDLILPPEAGIGQPVVHVLDRERDAARLEMTLDPAEKSHGVVRAFVVRHAAALTADRDDRAHALVRAEIDELAQARLDLVVDLGMDDAVLE